MDEDFYVILTIHHNAGDIELTMEQSGCSLFDQKVYRAGQKAVLEGKGIMIYRVE